MEISGVHPRKKKPQILGKREGVGCNPERGALGAHPVVGKKKSPQKPYKVPYEIEKEEKEEIDPPPPEGTSATQRGRPFKEGENVSSICWGGRGRKISIQSRNANPKKEKGLSLGGEREGERRTSLYLNCSKEKKERGPIVKVRLP